MSDISSGAPQSADLTSPEQFVTLKRLAAILGVPYHAVLRAKREGQFPTYRFGNGRILARVSEVKAAIERTRSGGAL